MIAITLEYYAGQQVWCKDPYDGKYKFATIISGIMQDEGGLWLEIEPFKNGQKIWVREDKITTEI